MNKINSLSKFFNEVGILHDSDKLIGLDIESDHFTGYFKNERGQEVLVFCRHNPEYHIVSFLGNFNYINRYSPHAFIYYLANKNPDPALFLEDRMTESEFLEAVKDCLATHRPALKRRIFGDDD